MNGENHLSMTSIFSVVVLVLALEADVDCEVLFIFTLNTQLIKMVRLLLDARYNKTSQGIHFIFYFLQRNKIIKHEVKKLQKEAAKK